MNRRDFLKTSGLSLASSLLLPGIPALTSAFQTGTQRGQAGARARKPNILLIVADDLGYAELGVQGCRDIPTPNIDSVARNGVRFTNGYVSCPVCSPTRAGLMTGRYQQRFGHEFNPGPAQNSDANFGLPLDQTTIANRLKSLGYATGMFGKWHLGYQPAYNPTKRGFDEFFGFLGGAHSYLNAQADRANPIMRGTEPVNEPAYLTEAFAREAVSFIDRHRNEPFFVYLPFNAVHMPLEATERYLARFEPIADERRRTFAAMLAAEDEAVGQVLAKLRDSKLEEDTLVFFISDNGGPTPTTTSGNLPLRGYKAQTWEGGIRIPYLVQWKGQLPAGKVMDDPVISLDVLPTAVAAAGGNTGGTALDGVNLLPLLKGESKNRPHETLFWRFGRQWAVRKGDWKLVAAVNQPTGLYNLAGDVGEKNDLIASQPEKAKELQTAYEEWNAQLMEPRWKQGAAAKQQQRAQRQQQPARRAAKKRPVFRDEEE